MTVRDVCCGFGGACSIKYPRSECDGIREEDRVVETKADVLTAPISAALMNIAGKAAREGKAIDVAISPRSSRVMSRRGVMPSGIGLVKALQKNCRHKPNTRLGRL